MPRFGINLRRKSNPHSVFDQETTTLLSRQKQSSCDGSLDGSCSSITRSDGKECADEKNNFTSREEETTGRVLGGAKDHVTSSRMKTKSTPGKLSTGENSSEQSLRDRRNGICNEIERRWFLQGAYLEKHRHNLQVTHELTARGLMWS
ncbi:hypothetical protein OS493_000011 [Desmophyllum pertusum]|uniref:Uncharacterized protein n=1 Tax=Desmophyllum pertusum TaxID=174260 RepID=A0A9X0A9W3_9CNID|nr:hypothetical protein OS493_000011 [Desmophyllum pertusum]